MNDLTEENCVMLKNMPSDTLLNLFHMHIRNIWRVDGLYFLGIEEKFGTEAATQIDTDCWKVLGKLEARELKTLLKQEKNDIPSLMLALKNTSWSLYQEQKKNRSLSNQWHLPSCQMSYTTNTNQQRLRRIPMQKRKVQLLEELRQRIQPQHQSQMPNLPAN